jgi:hypothetical protein
LSYPRRHHYIPEVYLKNFAVPTGKVWKIVAKSRNGHTFLTNINKVAKEKDFYTVEELEDKYYWERYYSSNIEQMMGDTFRQLVLRCNSIFTRNKDIILDDDTQKRLAVIMVIQLLRTPKSRRYQNSIIQDVAPPVIEEVKIQFKDGLSLEHQKILEGYNSPDKLKGITMSIINDPKRISKLASILLTKSWTIYKISDHKICSFVTSDHPVCMYNIDTKSTDLHDTGIGKMHTIINYPISARLLLSLYDRNTYFFGRGLFHKKIVELDVF